MADDLQANLQSYVLQLQQVEAALTIDPDNEELQKLKIDLEEVLTLTKDLIKQQLLEARKNSLPGGSADAATLALLNDEDILNPIPRHDLKPGDKCMAMCSDDGEYYEAVIEDMSEDQEQVTVKLVHNGLTEVTAPAFIRPITKPTVKKKTEPDQRHRKQTQSQREYQKKKKLKKQMRYKQLEEERETEKNKWLAFTSKKKGGLLTKKSIFASPDSVTGRVGIGTCGVSGLPMTEFSHAEKRKKGV
ncbi:UNVERIFIED_CONTAM: hypothetical protein PYX00_010661 [Menopon gallinae]|uniref:Tudor domain-containing protein n=1 Tax=Menopon gallinae TaxID=328185 RepID=A0AAW2HG48_9NEOP